MLARHAPRFLACLAAASVTLLLLAARQDPKPDFKPEPPLKPTWKPKVGDKGVVYTETGERIALATTIIFYGELNKLVAAGDQDGFRQMIERKQALWLAKGTGVLVLEQHDNRFIADHVVLELRVLDGPHKGEKVYAPLGSTAKSVADAEAVKKARQKVEAEDKAAYEAEMEAIAKRRAEAERKEAEAKKRRVDAKKRAEDKKEKQRREAQKKRPATLLSQAKALESNKQARQALDYYRKIVKEYPDSAEARAAKERIRALEADPPKP